MIRPYRERRRGGHIRYLPLLTVNVQTGFRMVDVNALVDSGAEHNVFSIDIARRLQLDVKSGQPVTLNTIAGETTGYLMPVNFELGRQQWRAPVIFTDSAGHPGILGQQGFFKYFTVTFKYRDRVMNIRRVK